MYMALITYGFLMTCLVRYNFGLKKYGRDNDFPKSFMTPDT